MDQVGVPPVRGLSQAGSMQGSGALLDAMTPQEFVDRCADDLPFYAEECLSILDKAGETTALRFNSAQRYVHERLEEQLSRTGRVRAIILKGRQQGVSTYVQARWRWRVKHRRGRKAYVMAHEQSASDNLFRIAKRYHELEPTFLRPSVGASNAKELWFDKLDSRYEVVTAGSRETGRSGTSQYLHGSEAAFWPNADAHWASIGQTVPDLPGTEIIIESTANGQGNEFHKRWKRAEAGLSEFIAIFVPWFWQTEYRKEVGPSFRMDADEAELAEQFGLDAEQVAWRRAKIADDFNGDVSRFQQEYPCTPSEAFVASNRDTLIDAKKVLAARKAKGVQAVGPLVLGVDPARHGPDRTSICFRRGRVIQRFRVTSGKSVTQVAGLVMNLIEEHHPAKVFIDVGGLGAGVYDILVDSGYEKIVVAVNFGESATDDVRFRNKRAECWGLLKDWIHAGPVQIPDSDELEGDLLAPGYSYDSHGRLLLEPKEKIREREGRSPDLGDSAALTFAEPVRQKPKREVRVGGFATIDSEAGY